MPFRFMPIANLETDQILVKNWTYLYKTLALNLVLVDCHALGGRKVETVFAPGHLPH